MKDGATKSFVQAYNAQAWNGVVKIIVVVAGDPGGTPEE